MHKKTGSPELWDGVIATKPGLNEELDRIGAAIDWSLVGVIVDELHSSRRGRPSYPPLVMVKVLLLQQWHGGASDEAMEAALDDRRSFRRFVGLGAADAVPDHSTISRFRSAFASNGCAERVFDEINRQLDGLGLMVKDGTIMDATLVQAQARSRTRRRDEDGATEVVSADPDAVWAGKGGRARYGYKVHIGMDKGSGLVRKAGMTQASTNETDVADDLVSGDEAAVYGDRAYSTHKRTKRLRGMGIKDRTMLRANKHHGPLVRWKKLRNELIGRRRWPVEKVFGTLKRVYNYRRVRYLGLERNTAEMRLKLIAYNLRRADVLLQAAA